MGAWCGHGEAPAWGASGPLEPGPGPGTSATNSRVPPQGSAQALPLCGAAQGSGQARCRGSLTPPRRWDGSCAAPSMATKHVHLHTHRRHWLECSSTALLVELSQACLRRRSLPRLERLVESVLLARWRALPPAQHDPELRMRLPH